MGDPDPRRAIFADLTQPAAVRPPAHHAFPLSSVPARPVAFSRSGNPFTADPATIQFVKERGIPGRRLFAVTFDDQHENNWFWLAATELDPTGCWVASGVAGGSGEIPRRSEPWVNLAGSWGLDRLYVGGQIHTAGAAIGNVRLTLANANGSQLTDDADADVALFLATEVGEPLTVEIYDTDGRLLASHAAF